MKLKKLLTMLLTLTMLFSLAACGREEKPAETGQAPSPVQTGEGTGGWRPYCAPPSTGPRRGSGGAWPRAPRPPAPRCTPGSGRP